MPTPIRVNRENRYRAQWEFTNRIANVNSTPVNLQIARSNLCNFKCVYCVDHRIGNEIPRTKNEGETWEKLTQLIPRSERLRFHGISEFMIDPDFFTIVQRCAEAGATLDINTNGSVCTPKHLDVLGNYPNYLSMNFSIDATSPETFLRVRGYDYWRILRNIRSYFERFEERRVNSWLTLSFVIMKSSVHEMMPLVYLGKALRVDSIIYYRLHEYDGLDWRIEAKHGGVFDYLEECVNQFPEEYNQQIQRTRQLAETLGVHVELPALLH